MHRVKYTAFTLVELVMVIVIIGLLAAVVTPQFTSMRGSAETAAEEATVAAVRTGIKMVRMSNLAQGLTEYPVKLDSAKGGDASESNPLFTEVVEGGLTDENWRKIGGRSYYYKPTKTRYDYDRKTGTFKARKKK